MILLKLTSAVTLLKLMANPLLKKAQFTFYKTNLITARKGATHTHIHTHNQTSLRICKTAFNDEP